MPLLVLISVTVLPVAIRLAFRLIAPVVSMLIAPPPVLMAAPVFWLKLAADAVGPEPLSNP